MDAALHETGQSRSTLSHRGCPVCDGSTAVSSPPGRLRIWLHTRSDGHRKERPISNLTSDIYHFPICLLEVSIYLDQDADIDLYLGYDIARARSFGTGSYILLLRVLVAGWRVVFCAAVGPRRPRLLQNLYQGSCARASGRVCLVDQTKYHRLCQAFAQRRDRPQGPQGEARVKVTDALLDQGEVCLDSCTPLGSPVMVDCKPFTHLTRPKHFQLASPLTLLWQSPLRLPFPRQPCWSKLSSSQCQT